MSVAVVLMAYGSPDRLEDVPAYYADIRGGRPIRQELLEELVERYRSLGVGREAVSPLNAVTEEQRAALERELGVSVFTGMRHWQPRIAEAAGRALASGARVVVGLVLAPHYSTMSIGAYRRRLEEAVGDHAELRFVDRWGDEPGLHALWAEKLVAQSNYLSSHVVFTAHSLPARILEQGDPYRDELIATSAAIAERAGLRDWSFSFQSESATGEPWLGPDILEHLDELAAHGTRDVLLCPIGFVSEHLEIRWDLDVEAARRASDLGVGLRRVDMPNAEPALVDVLAALVRRAAAVPSVM